MLTVCKIPRAQARGLRLVSHVLLLVQLLSLGHLFLVHHVTCPEHGDLVHVEASTGPALGQPESTEGSQRTSVGGVELTIAAEHDHCLVCAENSRRCLLTTPAQANAGALFVASEAYVVATVFVSPIDLIRLSPKNSPPSV